MRQNRYDDQREDAPHFIKFKNQGSEILNPLLTLRVSCDCIDGIHS